MSLSLEWPLGLSDLDKVFQVSEFLDNADELIEQFKPEMSKYLVKEGFFKGRFLREYNKQFDILIQSLIRKEVVKHFQDYNPEDIVLLTDMDLIKMLSPKLFEKKNYLSKEGKNNEQH